MCANTTSTESVVADQKRTDPIGVGGGVGVGGVGVGDGVGYLVGVGVGFLSNLVLVLHKDLSLLWESGLDNN